MHTLTTQLAEHAMRMRGEADAHDRHADGLDAQPLSGWEEYDMVPRREAKDLRALAAEKRLYAEYADIGKFAYRMDDIGRPYEYAHLHGLACTESRDVKLDDQGRPMGPM